MTFAIQTIELGKRFYLSQGYQELLLRRRRRQVVALKDVNLQIPQGEVFGILGPNGAGKTTLFKILSTVVLPTTGQALVNGLDVVKEPELVKEVLTYAVSEERSLYWRLTGRQNLLYFAAISNIPRKEAKGRVLEILDLLELGGAADQRVMSYSTGMRQRLVIARALLAGPEILLLDEPTRSLDPLLAAGLWQFIREELVARQGKTVLLATHNLEEAQRVCHRFAVLHRGQLRACGSVEELSAVVAGQHRYSLMLDPSANGISQVLANIPGVVNVQESPSVRGGAKSYDFLLDEPKVQVPIILERVLAAKGRVLGCIPHEQSLLEVLAALTRETQC